MWALLRATDFFYNSIAISVAVVWFTYFVCVFQKVSFWWVYGSSFVYVRFFRVSEIFRVLQWVTGHLGLAQVFWVGLGYSGFSCGIAHSDKNLISIFQEFSSSVDGEGGGGAGGLEGGWALGYHSMQFGQFPGIS